MDLDRKRDSDADFGWLLQLVDALPTAAVYRSVQSPDGHTRFEYASSGFERMFGLSPELLAEDATPLFEMMGARGLERIAPLGSAAIDTGSSFDYEGPMLLPSGETRWFLWHSRPTGLEDGRRIWVGVCLDITRRKETELHAKRLEGILPICAHCKKIRDGDEQWVRLEDYVTGHSAAKFTHGMCPDCIVKHLGKEFL